MTTGVEDLPKSGLDVGTTAYVGSNWLEMSGTNFLGTNYSYGWVQPAYPWTITETRREMVKLKLSEVEVLREAARKNPEVKKVLNKLSHLIEIEVDF